MRASQRTSVCVRVWLPLSATDVGHASLETFEGGEHGDGYYVSLWPAEGVDKLSEAGSKKTACTHTLKQDIAIEGRHPEVTVYFYSLDHQAINAAIDESDFQHWSLFRTSAEDTSVQNCSGSVIYLLQKGGISKLVSRIESNAADVGSGLVGGVGGGAVVYLIEAASGPLGWAAAAVTLAAVAGANYWQRNVIAQITASPTDVAKYVLYAKKQEQETLGKKSDDPTRVNLSGHKNIFNFAWINSDDFKAPELDDLAADEADYAGAAAIDSDHESQAVVAEAVVTPPVAPEIDPMDWPLYNGMPEQYLFSGKHHGISPALFKLRSEEGVNNNLLMKPIVAFLVGYVLSQQESVGNFMNLAAFFGLCLCVALGVKRYLSQQTATININL